MDLDDLDEQEHEGVKFACSCGKRLRVRRPGSIVRCPKCGRILQAPGAKPAAQQGPAADEREARNWRRWGAMAGIAVAAALVVWIAASLLLGAVRQHRERADQTTTEAQRAKSPAAKLVEAAVVVAVLVIVVWFAVALAKAGRERAGNNRILKEASALKDEADALYNAQEFAAAKLKYEEALEKLEEFPGEAHVLQGIIEEVLRSDDIRFGSNPDYRRVDGKWVLTMASDDTTDGGQRP